MKERERERTQDAQEDVFLNMHLNPVRWAFAQRSMLVWVHKPILPPGLKTALASRRPQGTAFIWRASCILDTYGAETDLRNKLSSNNQIIHVSGSNNGGMWADMSETFPSGMPLCVLGVPVDKGLLLSPLLSSSWSNTETCKTEIMQKLQQTGRNQSDQFYGHIRSISKYSWVKESFCTGEFQKVKIRKISKAFRLRKELSAPFVLIHFYLYLIR